MTFESTPPDYSSVNSHLVYVVYDAHAADPATYPNYKYVAELYIDTVLVFTAKAFPHPDTNRGIFDFADVIREYVSNNLDVIGTGIVAQNGVPGTWATKAVVVKIKEEYSGTIGAVVLTDSDRYFFNHYNGRYSNFTLLGGYSESQLTNRPATINLLNGGGFYGYFMPYFLNTDGTMDVKITDNFGTFHTLTVTAVSDRSCILLNLAPRAINSIYSGFITTSTLWYDVLFVSSGSTFRFNLICAGMYENYYVHFMNKLGGFETMLFNKASRKMHEVEKKKYQQQPYRVDGSGVVTVKTGNVMHEQQTTFAARFKETLKISTDLLSDADHSWLAELVDSPLVYLEDKTGTLYPVAITETNYDFKSWLTDNLANLSITVEFGTTYKTQFR